MAMGADGSLSIGGLVAGHLTQWRVVISPTTGKPTLFGEGYFKRYYAQAVGTQVRAALRPAAPASRIGRPKPKAPKPFVLVGKLLELTARSVTISEGEII